jgi:hypothetical protein
LSAAVGTVAAVIRADDRMIDSRRCEREGCDVMETRLAQFETDCPSGMHLWSGWYATDGDDGRSSTERRLCLNSTCKAAETRPTTRRPRTMREAVGLYGPHSGPSESVSTHRTPPEPAKTETPQHKTGQQLAGRADALRNDAAHCDALTLRITHDGTGVQLANHAHAYRIAAAELDTIAAELGFHRPDPDG